jgi:hypothetical protein
VSPSPEPRRLSETLDQVLRGLGAPPADVLARLATEWVAVVGADVAAHAIPLTIAGGRLVVVVDHPAYATRMRFADRRLRSWLDGVSGGSAVAGVDVRIQPPGTLSPGTPQA